MLFRSALQNKQLVILRMAFRARKVLGTFEKRAHGRGHDGYRSIYLMLFACDACFLVHKLQDYEKHALQTSFQPAVKIHDFHVSTSYV